MSQSPTIEVEEPLLRQVDRWWFGYGSATTLGVFRICIGTLTFLSLLMLVDDWRQWYSEDGYVPAWLGKALLGPDQAIGIGNWSVPRLSLLGGVTDSRVAIAFYAVTTLAALLTAMGLFTRVSAFVLALGFISLHHRNINILHGGDTLDRIMVIYLAVSPCGRACSLDRLFRLRRGEEDGEPVQISLWSQRLIQFNLALIYFTTVWGKWFGTKWVNGTATWYPSRLAEFYRFPVPAFFNSLPMVRVTTYSTLFIEFALSTLVFFRPIRTYVLFAGVILHGTIEYSMNIPLFSYFMISCYVSHYEGDEITAFFRRLGDRLRSLFGLEVFLPPNRRLTESGTRFLHAVDPFGFVRYVPNAHPRDVDEGWDAKKENGKRSNPFRGVAYRAPGAWIFLVVPTLWKRMMLRSTEPVG